jgi:hypothetical protein
MHQSPSIIWTTPNLVQHLNHLREVVLGSMKAETPNNTEKILSEVCVNNDPSLSLSKFPKGGLNQGRLATSDILTESSSIGTLKQIMDTASRSTLLSESFYKIHAHVDHIDSLGLQGRNRAALPKLKPKWEIIHQVNRCSRS